MSETYEQRMTRLSNLHYLHNEHNSADFYNSSAEEFETWKGRIGLSEDEGANWYMRRNFLSKYFNSLVEEYVERDMKPEVFLSLLCKAATEKDNALLGRTVRSALENKSLNMKRPVVASYLRSYSRFLQWLKVECQKKTKGTKLQNEIKKEIKELSGQEISGSTIEDWLKPGSNSQ